MEKLTEHTGACYEGKVRAYAEAVDTKTWNADYERPATVSLLPPLKNLRVLDAGCGSGWYAEYLLDHGATVTAFDFSPEFVALTEARVGTRARVLQADLSVSLDFAATAEFDLVVCPLVIHYLKDWEPVFREFHRVLKPEGVLVFSTHHPFMDWIYHKTGNYFTREIVEDEWEKIGKIKFYRRPLTLISQDLAAAGFVIERLLEPQPTETFRQKSPAMYERLTKNPQFLFIRARKEVAKS